MRLHALRSAYAGRKWGDEQQLEIGSKVKDRYDYRPGRTHRPHPFLALLNFNFKIPRQLHDFVGGGKWVAGSMIQAKDGLGVEAECLVESFRSYFRMELSVEDITDVISVSHVIDSHSSAHYKIQQGDFVCVLYGPDGSESERYCMVERFVCVRVKGERFAWVFPRWFTSYGSIHPIRGTTLVVKEPNDWCSEPIPWMKVVRQVMITHHCYYKVGGCPVVNGSVQHNTRTREYEVAERKHVFVANRVSWRQFNEL